MNGNPSDNEVLGARGSSILVRSQLVVALLAGAALVGCGSDEAKDPIARGQEAVVSHACESCHTQPGGQTLAGNEAAQPQTTAYPANLTPDPDTGLGGWDDATLMKAILNGVDDEAKALCPPMPHFADQGVTEDQARDIVAYLKSLPPVKHAVPESACAEKK